MARSESRVWDGLLALGVLYTIFVFFFHFDTFPALHGDEGLTGLAAVEILRHGVVSPHFVSYSSPTLTVLLAELFRWGGVSVFNLRVLVPVINTVALLLMTIFLRREFGVRSAVGYVLLILSSLLMVLKAHISWEITAFNPLMFTLMVIAAYRFLKDDTFAPFAALLFLSAQYFAVVSHFYFLVIPCALLVAATFTAAIARERRWWEFAALSWIGFAQLVFVYLFKPRISIENWQQYRMFYLTLFAVFPFLWVGVWSFGHRWIADSLRYVVEWFTRAPRARWAWGLFGAGALYGFLNARYHLLAFAQTLSNTAIQERIYSHPPAAFWCALGWVWSVALIAALVYSGRTAWRRSDWWSVYLSVGLFWFFVIVKVFTARNSNRYYMLPYLLSALILVVAGSRLRPRLNQALLGVALVVAIAFQGLNFSEMFRSDVPRPYYFTIGSMNEQSWSYMPLGEVVEELRRTERCPAEGIDPFLFSSLSFLREVSPWPCREQVRVEYCFDCEAPPYVRVSDSAPSTPIPK